MSCNEWEAGTIVLPTAEAPKVRDAVKTVAEKYRQRLYDTAQEFWKALPASYKKDPKKYEVAMRAFVHGNVTDKFDAAHKTWHKVALDKKLPNWKGFDERDGRMGFTWDLDTVLRGVLVEFKEVTKTSYNGAPFVTTVRVETPPHRVKWPDVDRVIPKPTGASFSLQCGEGHLRFEGRKLHWEVYENNHAREYGREHPIAQALFAALDKVKWTRGSGGTIVGNDEYNQDSRSVGGGGNYVITEYGPHVKKVPRYPTTLAYSGWYR